MKFLKEQWEKFKAKSLWSKITDVLFLAFVVMMLSSDGRILLQRGILATGIFGSVSANADTEISAANWEWEVYDLEGQRYTLAEFEGRPIFLNFWATWCPPCNAEIPYIQEMVEGYSGDAVFLLVTSESPEKVKAYLKKKEWDLPVYFMGSYPTAELESSSLPTTVVIDSSGTIVHRSEGMRKWSAEGLEELLH